MGMMQMMLASGQSIVLLTQTFLRQATGAATAHWQVRPDGFVWAADNSSGGAVTQRYQWCFPASAAANFDLRWSDTVPAPDTNPGAQNTNFNLGTSRNFTETNNVTTETCTFSVRIHVTGDTTNPLVTAAITLNVDGS